MRRQLSGSGRAPHCRARDEDNNPWKYRWAGAATPAQQNTTRTQEPPRRASDVSYGSNPYRKDNPTTAISNAVETLQVPVAVICAAWLIGLPRRAGAWLHSMTDEEARQWHWRVSERHGGLVHQYRDERFAALRLDSSLRNEALR
jgi:hypothetical protein